MKEKLAKHTIIKKLKKGTNRSEEEKLDNKHNFNQHHCLVLNHIPRPGFLFLFESEQKKMPNFEFQEIVVSLAGVLRDEFIIDSNTTGNFLQN